MKKSAILFLHLGVWLCYFIVAMGLMAAFFQGNENAEESLMQKAFGIITMFGLIPSVFSFYLYYFFLFPKFFKKKQYFETLVYGLVISAIAGLIGYAMLFNFVSDTCSSEEEDAFAGIVIFIAFIATISGVIALVIQGFITWFHDMKLKEALIEKNHRIELALVKSQLDPHFLFNTINNIDVLILKDQEEASDYLNKLSDIMRFMLFETKTEEVLLSKEIEYIEKYIELQKIRTANTDYIQYNIEGFAKDRKIAPMVFIPFIENAFKHCTNKKLSNAIQIKISIESDCIKMTCVNKYDPNRKVKEGSNGLGNDLIEKRLQLLYKNNHTLEVQKENNTYSVNVSICHE